MTRKALLTVCLLCVTAAAPASADTIEGLAGDAVNPAFVGWATGCDAYYRADGASTYADPSAALGEVTGIQTDIVSLGDLTQSQIDAGAEPGYITLTFDILIANGDGGDFAVFENGFGTPESFFGEFAYVEVSSNGQDFARFASFFDGAAAPVGSYGYVDVTNVDNLAGTAPNGYGQSQGTLFDLEDLVTDPLVTGGLLNLDAISHVRLVDIPGSGDYTDAFGNPIYDAWWTYGSGGFDLEAVGVLNTADPVVPEPATFALMGLGLAAAYARGFRTRKG